jgi:hypothetical protein
MSKNRGEKMSKPEKIRSLPKTRAEIVNVGEYTLGGQYLNRAGNGQNV